MARIRLVARSDSPTRSSTRRTSAWRAAAGPLLEQRDVVDERGGGKPAREADLLRQVAEPAPDVGALRRYLRLAAKHAYLAPGGRQRGGQQPDQRRLAGAVGAEQPDHAGLQVQVYAGEGHRGPVRPPDAAHAYRSGGHRCLQSRSWRRWRRRIRKISPGSRSRATPSAVQASIQAVIASRASRNAPKRPGMTMTNTRTAQCQRRPAGPAPPATGPDHRDAGQDQPDAGGDRGDSVRRIQRAGLWSVDEHAVTRSAQISHPVSSSSPNAPKAAPVTHDAPRAARTRPVPSRPASSMRWLAA